MLHCKLFYLLFFGGSTLSSCQNGPIVNTPLGSILGTIQTSRKGRDFYSFRGIRYATAPRFKPPEPVKAWDGTLNATQDGPACYQTTLDHLSEDCLYLNVYTRKINNLDSNRPVLAYIHGGAFDHWSGQSTVHGPDYMMDYDIVLVTFNYRLGTLGFFSTGDEYAPGNYGMKDQVLALKWIRDNVQHFGGNPNEVTIAGESAGGASVGLHLVSPMSRGLFHRAIIMSGSPINFRTINKNPIQLARKQADLLGCPSNRSKDMVDCVGKIAPEDIPDMYSRLKDWNSFGRINSPVVEHEECNCERFLEKDPLVSLIEGNFENVPVFIGITKDEFIQNAVQIFKNESAVADLSENFSEIAPKIFIYERNDTLSKILRQFYLKTLNNSTSNEDALNGLGELFSDSYVIFHTIRTAKLLAKKNKEPVYLYQFNYLGDGLKSCFADELPNRVAHQHDLSYVFYMPVQCPIKFNATGSDGEFVTKYTTLWYNFIKTGNPTPQASTVLDHVTWEPYDDTNPKYLDINDAFEMRNGLFYNDRISLWENLFPIKN